MKIERLDLKAFGCFRDVTLDFNGSEHGMFLIYGHNEAGKSTALNAIRQWFYEFDRNVAIEFLHKKSKQRVGGSVSCNGQRLSCFRKRGNANTLVDDADQPIGDDALRPFLHGIDERRFATIFGINHLGLREGGRDIAAGKGDLGQALFAAGSGLLHLDRVQKRLTAARDEMFAVRGERPVINACLRRCEDIRARKAQARLPLAEIEEQLGLLAELTDRRQQRRSELTALEHQRADIDRLVRITPLVQRRRVLQQRLDNLRGRKQLRANFRDDFQRIDGELLKECNKVELLREQWTRVEEELAQIMPDPPVLHEQDRLRRLAKEVGAYETDSKDRRGLQREHNLIEGEAKQKLRALGREPSLAAEAIDPLRLDEQERNRIRDLGTKRAEFFTSADNCRKKVAGLELDQHATEEDLGRLAVPISVEPLGVALERITKMGDLEKAVQHAARELAERDRALNEALSRLPLWPGRSEQIVGAKVPAALDVEYHRDQIEAARKQSGEAAGAATQFNDLIGDLNNQLERLRLSGEVPTEQDVQAERARRQRGWELIRSAWLDGQRDPATEAAWINEMKPGASLADAYEAAVQRSDQGADRLRREAQRVSEQARLLADVAAAQKKSASVESKVQQAQDTLRAAEVAWRAIWKEAAIEPRSPKEMRAWHDQWQKLVRHASDRQTAADALERASAECAHATRDIRAALEACQCLPTALRADALLAELIDLASARIKEAVDLRQQRQRLEEDLRRIRRELAKAEVERQGAEQKKIDWQRQWEAALRFLEPKQPLLPEEANRILDTLLEFWKKINDLKNRRSRLEGIDKRSGGFPQAVADLVQRLEGKSIEGEDTLRAYERLQARLKDAEAREHRRGEKLEKAKELKELVSAKEGATNLLQQQLERLCQEAGVEEPGQLPEAIRCSEELREVESMWQQCTTDLQLQGGSADLEALCRLVSEAEAQQRDYDQERGTLQGQIDEKKAALDAVNQEIGAVEQAVKALRGRAGSADLAAQEESEHARLRDHVEDFTTLVLAARVLTEAVKRYREGNASGLLAEASALFRSLTCGSFDRLSISEGDDGKPFLIGVRPDGAEVHVDGMSDGTCDQLYLSLRLAHLKRHVAKEGPFPLIVDDILLAFDNDRARAALNCLADLGASTQVLLFTHHRHIREMATAAEFSGRIAIRELP